MRILGKILFCGGWVITWQSLVFEVKAQITATQTTPNNAVFNVLLGSGVNAFGVTSLGSAPISIGTFSNGSAAIGMNSGVYLSTANINQAGVSLSGPAASNFFSENLNAPGDADLQAIVNNTTFDAAILQFYFIPAGDSIKFRYVFASEEYNEFVNTGFNDVFAFFLSGPNPQGGNYNNTNIALIPGTSTPVSINNVNNGNANGCAFGPCNNCQYYVDNCNAQNFAFDGRTVVLTARAAVIPCDTYLIKLAVADVGDGVFDSMVFLEANSFGSGAVNVSATYNYSNASGDSILYEGCSDVTLTFIKLGGMSSGDTASVVIGGTATNGVDYTVNGGPMSNQIIFPAGVDSVQLTLTPMADSDFGEGDETVIFQIYNITPCGDTIISEVFFYITNVTPISVNAGVDVQVCPGVTFPLFANISGGVPPYTVTWAGPGGPGNGNPFPITVDNTTAGTYTLTVQDGCALFPPATDDITITIGPPQFALSFQVDSVSCFNNSDGAINLTVTGQVPPFTFQWSNNATGEDLTNLSAGTYTVTVTDSVGCQITETVTVHQPQNLSFPFQDQILCPYVSYPLNPNPDPSVTYSWSPTSIFPNPNAPNPVVNIPNPTGSNINVTVTVQFTKPGFCGDTSFVLTVLPVPLVQVGVFGPDTAAICEGSSIILQNDTVQPPGYPSITGYTWNTGATTPSITVSEEGQYVLSVATTNNCIARDSVFVNVMKPIQPVLGGPYFICGNQTVQISVPDSVEGLFIWNTGDSSRTITVSDSGKYTVTVLNPCGTFTASAQVAKGILVTAQNLYNIITPFEEDGKNDIWHTAYYFEGAEEFSCQIFNRWGNRIYSTSDPKVNWKPKNNSSGVYFYTIRYKDCSGKAGEVNGTITVVQ
ncbi:MAG: choice-of-anchor L domain-containing protein [Flavobacteriales bacterium]|nr:choice-of-anchor L domain-containing protein [Flavobacteriales bacterium]